MRALAAGLPDALVAGFHEGREVARPASERLDRVVAVGMGGSGIASDLARGVVESETPLALDVVRSPTLPRGIGTRSHVLLVSYSGNTWETLEAFVAAGRAGAPRTVITSGGALADRARQEGVPVLSVPPGLPPRSAVGHLLGGILGLLDPAFPESNEARVTRIADGLRRRVALYARARGPAAQIAEKIGTRLPFVYAESTFLALARRWKTQFEENAKRLAVFDEVPELFHNALVGWDAIPRREAAAAAAILLEWSEEVPPVRKSFRYLEQLLRHQGVPVARVPLAHEDRLEALLDGVTMGDHVSLFVADRRKVDPLPVDAITRLKAAIGTPSLG